MLHSVTACLARFFKMIDSSLCTVVEIIRIHQNVVHFRSKTITNLHTDCQIIVSFWVGGQVPQVVDQGFYVNGGKPPDLQLGPRARQVTLSRLYKQPTYMGSQQEIKGTLSCDDVI
jgi:hypothetical protein